MYTSFGNFVDKKKRDTIKQLRLVGKLLHSQGMEVEEFLDDMDEAYIFCLNPNKNSSFQGVRLYKIGGNIAFRIQKESKTHPYGRAYSVPIEDMFNDFMTDEKVNATKAGHRVIESVAFEMKRFFEKSVDAEKQQRSQGMDKNDGSGVLVTTTGTDYSSLIYTSQ
jgi:hypothetical protein